MAASLRARRREIIALTLPATLALATDPLLSLIDTALVGRLGPVALAALGIDAAVFATLAWLFNFLTYGTTSEVARLRAAGDHAAADARITNALWLAGGIGAVLMALLWLAGPAALTAMGAHGEVHDAALVYLRIRALAMPPALLALVGHGAFRGFKDTRTPLLIVAALNAVDALASWALIYPAGLGIAGAAWGTVLAQAGAALWFVWLLAARTSPGTRRPRLEAMRAIVQVSRDLFLRTAALVLGLLLSTAATARMGTATLGAHQIARELWVFLTLALDGFAIAAQAMIATSLGQGQVRRAYEEALTLLRWGVIAGVILGAGFFALSGPLPALFSTDAAVLGEVRRVWWVVALLQPVGAVVFVLDGVFLGAHDYRFLKWTTVAGALGLLVPLCFIALWLGWGIGGIWLAMSAMIAARLAGLLARLRQWPSVTARVRI